MLALKYRVHEFEFRDASFAAEKVEEDEEAEKVFWAALHSYGQIFRKPLGLLQLAQHRPSSRTLLSFSLVSDTSTHSRRLWHRLIQQSTAYRFGIGLRIAAKEL